MQERPPRPAGDSPQPMRQRTPWAGCFDLGHGVRGLWSRRQHHSELSLSGCSFRETLPWATGTHLSGKCIRKDLLGTVANWGPEGACMHSPLPPLKGTELQGSHPHYTGCAVHLAPSSTSAPILLDGICLAPVGSLGFSIRTQLLNPAPTAGITNRAGGPPHQVHRAL